MSEKSERLLEALSELNDSTIDAAAEEPPAKGKVRWKRWAALAAALAVLGWVLYQFRDRSVGAAEQEKLIFGDLLAEELPPTPCKISKK